MTKGKIRVLLYAGYGHPNTGDDSIVLGNILSLRSSGLEVDIVATSSDPERTSRLFGVRTVPDPLCVCRVRGHLGRVITAALLFFLTCRTVFALVFPQCRRLLLVRERLLLEQVELSDAMLIAGGGTLNDMYFGSGVIPFFVLVSWASLLHKPIFMGAQTIGPITRPWIRFLVKLMLQRVAFISVRERQSLTTLKQLGIGVPCSLALDDGYAVMQEDVMRDYVPSRGHFDRMEVFPEGNVILVGLRPWWRRNGKCLALMRKALDDISDALRSLENVFVLFVPMAFGQNEQDEPGLIEWFTRSFNIGNYGVAKGSSDPRVLMELFERAALGISLSTYHFDVFALSQSLPTVSFYADDYYQTKIHGLFDLYGIPQFAVDLRAMNGKSIVEITRALAMNTSRIRAHLNDSNRVLQERANLAPKRLLRQVASR